MDELAPIDESLQEAIAAYRNGKLEQVEVLCNKILDRQSDHIESLQLLAAAAGRKGEPQRGIALLEKAISLHPDSTDGYIQLAKLLKDERRFSEAIATLKRLIELQPECAIAYHDLGLIYLEEPNPSEAVACFDRAVKIQPGSAIAHFNQGRARERLGRRLDAIASFRQSCNIDPNFAEAHANLGNLLLNEGGDAEGIECLRRSVVARPGSLTALTSEATILTENNKAAEAEALMRRAIDLHPRNSSAHCQLGSILVQQGRFLEAATAFDLAVALDRRKIAGYFGLAHIKKLTEADRPLVAQIQWMLDEYQLLDDERVDLSFTLGKAFDDLGDFKTAIEYFNRGNQLKHRSISFDRARHAFFVDRLIAKFTADFFSRNAALGSKWEVPILILGMPRSGTTLVEQIISSHPEVAAGGELKFWEESAATTLRVDANGSIDPAWADKVASDYQRILAGISPSARRITDKKPQNFTFIGLIHAVFPRARIIHCRRHPVDTCLSIYFQNFARRIDFAYDRGDLLSRYRDYLRLMQHWRRVLPADRFLEIQYEELVADHEPLTRKMIEFCGLDWDEACLHPNRNRREVRTASVWQARQPVYRTSVARWRNYEPWLGELKELLSDADLHSSS